jgi:cyclase
MGGSLGHKAEFQGAAHRLHLEGTVAPPQPLEKLLRLRAAVEWAKTVAERGAGEILLTSMDADGTQAGYDLELTRRVAEAVAVPVIASGGAGECAHIRQALQEGGAEAALLASLLHYGQLTIAQIKADLAAHGIPVRR